MVVVKGLFGIVENSSRGFIFLGWGYFGMCCLFVLKKIFVIRRVR